MGEGDGIGVSRVGGRGGRASNPERSNIHARLTHLWSDVVPESDDAAYHRAGYDGSSARLGRRPGLLIIDMNTQFLGDRSMPLAESQAIYPYSCGHAGWKALDHLTSLLAHVRSARTPVFYASGRWRQRELGLMSGANSRTSEWIDRSDELSAIPSAIQPMPDDILIEKRRPSAFFGTPLISYCLAHGIDTLLLAGNTTSGCIRATAVDAYSFGIHPVIVEQCVFDRSDISHKVSLFDLHHKYAPVLSKEQVAKYAEQCA